MSIIKRVHYFEWFRKHPELDDTIHPKHPTTLRFGYLFEALRELLGSLEVMERTLFVIGEINVGNYVEPVYWVTLNNGVDVTIFSAGGGKTYLSVDSTLPLLVDWQGLFDVSVGSEMPFFGFSSKGYKFDHSDFSLELSSPIKMYTFFHLLINAGGKIA